MLGRICGHNSWGGGIERWSIRLRKRQHDAPKEDIYPTSLCHSPDSRRLAGTCQDGRILVWDAQSGDLVTELPGYTEWADCVVFHPDGNQLVSINHNPDSLRIWNSSDRTSAALQDHGTNIALSHCGSLVAVVDRHGSDPEVRLWNLEERQRVGRLELPDQTASLVQFSPDGRFLGIGGFESPRGSGRDGRPARRRGTQVSIWELATLEQKAIFQPGYSVVRGLAFLPDGKTLAVAGIGESRRLPLLLWTVCEQPLWAK